MAAVEAKKLLEKAGQIAREYPDEFLVDVTRFYPDLVLTAFTKAFSGDGEAYHLAIELDKGQQATEIDFGRFGSMGTYHLWVYGDGRTRELEQAAFSAEEVLGILGQLVAFKLPNFEGLTLRQVQQKYGYREGDLARLLGNPAE